MTAGCTSGWRPAAPQAAVVPAVVLSLYCVTIMGSSELLQLSLSFLRVGIFSLGGGNAMTKMIQHECVTAHGWLSDEEFGSIFGLCFLFPGLTQCKLAAMIGAPCATG